MEQLPPPSDPKLDAMTPRQIVAELDRYVIGQKDAKRMVAIALRSRWRRQQLSPELRGRNCSKKYHHDRPNRRRKNRSLASCLETR